MEKGLAERLSAFGTAWGFPSEVPPGKCETWVDPSVFEAYATHMVVNGIHDLELDRNDVLSLITGGQDDAKLDAIGLFIDRELILSEEDLDAALGTVTEDSKIEFILVQATLRDFISQGKLEKTCTGVANFAAPRAALVENALVSQWRRLKDQLLAGLAAPRVTAGHREIRLFDTYGNAPPGALLALVNSFGVLEIAFLLLVMALVTMGARMAVRR